MFRDDHDALLARLAALDDEVERHAAEIATRDAAIATRDQRIVELEAQVSELRKELIDREASLVDAQRRRNVESKPIARQQFAVGSAEARAEADRLLAEGVERHRKGDKAGATACFQQGLALVPNDPQLVRALRRYT